MGYLFMLTLLVAVKLSEMQNTGLSVICRLFIKCSVAKPYVVRDRRWYRWIGDDEFL